MEEELVNQRCNVVYYCPSAEHDIYAIYHPQSLPKAAADSQRHEPCLDVILSNTRILLDRDQGAFNEVFVSSIPQQCLDRLDVFANSLPTVVLIEALDTTFDDSPPSTKKQANAFPILRSLAADIQGARYQKHVLPFVLVVSSLTTKGDVLDAATTAHFLSAGAEEIILSPFSPTDLNRLVGHVREKTRPPARLIGFTMAQNLVNSIRDTSSGARPFHRPDESISKDRMQFVHEAVAKWAFPAHELDMDELTCGAMLMLEHQLRAPQLEQYRIARPDLMGFLLSTRRQYKHEREVSYHNWRHAVDVTQSIYQFLCFVGICPPAVPDSDKQKSSVEGLLTPFDGLVLLVSAIGHDVGHPGVNNAFLVACNHPLAQMYNDKSVLENYHCAAYSQLLRRYWPALTEASTFRSVLISTILATDMQRHFEYMNHMTELRQKVVDSDGLVDEWSVKDKESTRELLMALMMKCADISNISRPFDVSAAWAKILMNEFSRQGELESELDIPTCLFGGPPDRENMLAAAQSQKGFLNLFGFPLFQGIADVMPSIACAVETLERNRATWEERIAAEKEKREAADDGGHATFSSVGKEQVDQAISTHHNSEPTAVPQDAAQPPSAPVQRQAAQQPGGAQSQHPASRERLWLATGHTLQDDDKRASAPFLGLGGLPLTPTNAAASRRSSKDVALDQLNHLNSSAHPARPHGSRRGSADASFQLNQSFPVSRRGSKDESLTTILVTSQGSPGRKSPAGGPASGGAHVASSPPRSHAGTAARQGVPAMQKQAGARSSVPSSRSHATSSATATTVGDPHSPSTRPSSMALVDDDRASFFAHPQAAAPPGAEGPFALPEPFPADLDGAPKSVAAAVDALPPASGDSDETGRTSPRKSERGGVRESRSRSRMRSLKFWRKKKDVSGVDSGNEGLTGSP